MAGTSMASPQTAGVAALIWQKALSGGGSVSAEDIRTRLRTGATNLAAPLNSPTTTYTFDGVREGILSAPGALAP
jgi:subtilisin family serine protease